MWRFLSELSGCPNYQYNFSVNVVSVCVSREIAQIGRTVRIISTRINQSLLYYVYTNVK